MAEFYYQIKGMNNEGNWCWPPLFSDKISAANSKEARRLLEDQYGMKLPGSRLKQKADEQKILLTLIDLETNPFLKKRFAPLTCKQCGSEYTLNQKYLVNEGGNSSFCSSSCAGEFKSAEGIEYNVNFDFDGIHPPVIYKITNKVTGLCYIGKTTQAFTLRWYQHFYQGCGTKFHKAIKEYGVKSWIFEVIEEVSCPSKSELNEILCSRERYWIDQYDAVANGYNSV